MNLSKNTTSERTATCQTNVLKNLEFDNQHHFRTEVDSIFIEIKWLLINIVLDLRIILDHSHNTLSPLWAIIIKGTQLIEAFPMIEFVNWALVSVPILQ